MRSRLVHWWQRYKRFVIIALLLIGVIVIGGGYLFHWTWTGFVTQSSPPNTQLTKTLWDWMSLLIIPFILALVGVYFTNSERKNEQDLADQRAKKEQDLADQRAKKEQDLADQRTKDEQAASRDNQQEAALQSYLDRMSELLLEKNLHKSEPGAEVRNVARVRTLTMFYQLNTRRTNWSEPILPDREDSQLLSDDGKSVSNSAGGT